MSKVNTHACSDSKCLGCATDTKHADSVLLSTFKQAMKKGVPIIRPILVNPGYMFTIGMPRLSQKCKGELVMTLIDTQIGAPVLLHVCKMIRSGTLNPTEWKDGTVLSAKTLSLSVSLQIHILDATCISKYLGSSQHPGLRLPASKLAYQLIWADETNAYPPAHVAKQTFLK